MDERPDELPPTVDADRAAYAAETLGVPGAGRCAPSVVELAERFDIDHELGRGGMGVVYRAYDRQTHRDVALKVIRGRDLRPEQRARFEREGELAARLDHPGIVRVHSSGLAGQTPYLVYELIEGAKPISEAWRQQGLRERALGVAEAARALGQAHAMGIVHRDVKPANLLVDAEGRVRVTDFGLALAHELDPLTQSGARLGTPRYMAPEQIHGSREFVTPATDVWALGVVLYEALCGVPPFAGENLVGLCEAIREARPERPSARVAGVPLRLESVCLSALQADPAKRLQDGAALAHAIEDALGAPTRESPRGPWIAAGLAVLVLIGTLTLAAQRTPSGSLRRSPEVGAASDPAGGAGWRVGWAEVLAAKTPFERFERLEGWLARHPDGGHADRARAERERLLEAPLATMELKLLRRVRFLAQDRVLACGEDGRLVIGSLRDGGVRQVASDLGPLSPLAVTPDGRLCAYAGRRGVVVLNLETGQARVIERSGSGRALAFSPDGRRVAFALDDGWVTVYDLDLEEHVFRFGPLEGRISALAFSPDGASVAVGASYAGSKPGELSVFQPVSAKPRWRVKIAGRIHAIVPAGEGFAVANEAMLSIYAANTGAQRTFSAADDFNTAFMAKFAHFKRIADLAVSPDGSVLYSAAGGTPPQPGEQGDRNDVRAWNVETGERLSTFKSAREQYGSIALSADGALVALACTVRGRVEVWHREALLQPQGGPTPSPRDSSTAEDAWERLRRLDEPEARIAAGRRWLGRFPEHRLRAQVSAVVAKARTQPVALLGIRSDPSGASVAFPDPHTLVSLNGDGLLQTWNVADWTERSRVQAFPRGCFKPEIATRGGLIFAGGKNRALTVFYGDTAITRFGEIRPVALALSGDGTTLAASTSGGATHLVDLKTLTAKRFRQFPATVQAITFGHYSHAIAVCLGRSDGDPLGDTPNVLQVWDLRLEGERALAYQRDSGIALGRSLALRGEELLMGTGVGTIEVWGVRGGDRREPYRAKLLTSLGEVADAYGGSVRSLALSTDGGRLFAGTVGEAAWQGRLVESAFESRRVLRVLKTGGKGPRCLAVSPDGRYIAAGVVHGRVSVWLAD